MLLGSTTRSLLKSSVTAFDTSITGALTSSAALSVCMEMALRANTNGSPGGEAALVLGTTMPIGDVKRLAHEDSGSWPLMISLPYLLFLVWKDLKIECKSVLRYVESAGNVLVTTASVSAGSPVNGHAVLVASTTIVQVPLVTNPGNSIACCSSRAF